MADETLRMRAEVEDRFSGPLKALRAQLLDTSRQGAAHGEALAKGLGKAEAAAQATANTAKTVLNPALAAIGVTGLGAGVAVSGIVSALNSLGSNLSGLGALGRETGMAADQLRIFQGVASKFGISGDASSAAAKVFAQNMRDIRSGVGETMGFLQSQSPAVAEFAIKLKGTTNNDEANKLTEEFLERIPNAVDRGRLAERIYGNSDFGRLGDGSRGPIRDLNRSTEQKLGPLPQGAVESAERYERALADLRSSMQKVGTTIAMELLPPAERFVTWMDELASGKRKDLTDGLRNGMREIGAELNKIDWKGAGDSAKDMLLSTTALVKPLADSVKEIAAAIRSFNEGKYVEAFRHLDGGSGPLARKLAPLPGDDVLAKQDRLDQIKGQLQNFEAAQKVGPVSERSREQADRLRREMEKLTEEIRALRQKGSSDATAQKSSADGDGPFAGARVQTAGYGSARLYGGGSGPGYRGEQGERDAAREQFREHLKRTVPGYDGGDTVPVGPGGRVPSMDGVEAASGGSRNRPAKGALAANQQEAYRAARAEGLSDVAARALVANMSGESLRNPRDKHWDSKHTAEGIVQWDPQRAEAIRRKFGASPRDLSVRDQTRAAIDEIRTNPRFRPTLRALESDDPSTIMRALVGNFENPKNHRQTFIDRMQHYRGFKPDDAVASKGRMPSLAAGDFLPNGAPRVLKPNSMKDASGVTMDEASRLRAGQADGEGWAAREKARKAFEAMQQGEGRLDASAGRAGVVGGTKVEANGSVSVLVQKPGPETNVRTSASGNLFKDVVLSRGRTMAPAERT